MMGTLSYSSNNSGGSWWLNDDDWLALENAGWTVDWVKDSRDRWASQDGRWLGALAQSASIETEDFQGEVERWEAITGSDAAAEGCNCCGRPHSFTFESEGDTKYYNVETVSTGYWS